MPSFHIVFDALRCVYCIIALKIMELEVKQLSPRALKKLMEKKGWTFDKLATEAKLGKRRLIELAQGSEETRRPVRDSNFKKLCKVLNATPDQLQGEEEIAEEIKDAGLVTVKSKITKNAQMNYDLIEAAYDIKSEQLVQLAPLMFAILAEESFKWRQEQLDLQKQAIILEEKLKQTVYARKIKLSYDYSISEIIEYEQLEIDGRNPFTLSLEAANASMIPSADDISEGYGGYYMDGSWHNDYLDPEIVRQQAVDHRLTDRFTDFIVDKLRANPRGPKADIPDINVMTKFFAVDWKLPTRNIFDPQLCYISLPDAFESMTAGECEKHTCMFRLLVQSGHVRLKDFLDDVRNEPKSLEEWLEENQPYYHGLAAQLDLSKAESSLQEPNEDAPSDSSDEADEGSVNNASA